MAREPRKPASLPALSSVCPLYSLPSCCRMIFPAFNEAMHVDSVCWCLPAGFVTHSILVRLCHCCHAAAAPAPRVAPGTEPQTTLASPYIAYISSLWLPQGHGQVGPHPGAQPPTLHNASKQHVSLGKCRGMPCSALVPE